MAHLAGILGCLGLILGHLGRSWRHLWPVGGFISDYFCQTVPFYLVCWGPSWPILASPCRFIWFVGVHPGPYWPAHAISSGLSGSIFANLGQPVPFYLARWGPSWPILASPCRFIWFLGVQLGPSKPAHAISSALSGSILPNLRQPIPFYLARLGPSWNSGQPVPFLLASWGPS